MQIFNALNGVELKQFLLQRIESKLDEHGDFKESLTFPWIQYEFSVKVLSYPKQAKDAEPGIVVEGEGTATVTERGGIQDGPITVHEDGVEEVFDIKELRIIDTPDQARVDSKQPIPTPAPGPGGALVDKPVEFKLPLKQAGKK